MNSKPLSQEDFDAKRKEALANEPVTRSIPLSQLEMTDSSYADRHIKVAGKSVSVTPEFFRQLGNILHMSNAMQRDLTNGSFGAKPKSGNGGDAGGLFTKMVDTLKVLKTTKNGGGNVTLIGNPISGQLEGISDRGYNRIPNNDLFNIAERLVNQYPVLSPIAANVNGGGMGVGISLLSSADVPFKPRGDNGDDETFRFGFNLNNDKNTSLGDFAYRLICSNGMMGMDTKTNFMLRSLDNKSLGDMFNHIAATAKRGFIPMSFQTNLESAISTSSSFRELETLYRSVTGNLNYEDEGLRKHFRAQIAREFFPGYVRTIGKMASKNVDPNNLTDKQKAFISTGQNMWDVINNMTFLGSHDTGFEWKDQALLRKLGGKTMATEFDLQHAALLNF